MADIQKNTRKCFRYVTDASVAITVSAILFLLPSNLNELFCCSEKQTRENYFNN